MTNNELTLDQLQAVCGGGVFAKLGDIKADYRQQSPGHSKEQRYFPKQMENVLVRTYCTGYC